MGGQRLKTTAGCDKDGSTQQSDLLSRLEEGWLVRGGALVKRDQGKVEGKK